MEKADEINIKGAVALLSKNSKNYSFWDKRAVSALLTKIEKNLQKENPDFEKIIKQLATNMHIVYRLCQNIKIQ